MRFGYDRIVLDAIDLELADGESLAVVGPSGSGKTTLLSVLGLLLKPTSGSVLIDGETAPSAEGQRHRTRSRAFGWVPQTVNVLSRRTALDNVSLPLLAGGYRRDEANHLAATALDAVGLANHMSTATRFLSGGEVQRVCIARALAHRPRFLLADEPTGQLDHRTSVEVLGALETLVDQVGSGLVVVTHDPAVSDLCKRAVALVDGKTVNA